MVVQRRSMPKGPRHGKYDNLLRKRGFSLLVLLSIAITVLLHSGMTTQIEHHSILSTDDNNALQILHSQPQPPPLQELAPVSQHESTVSAPPRFDFCHTSTRCRPIHLHQDLMSYVHISKTAGSSWIQELKRLHGISTRSRLRDRPDLLAKTKLYPLRNSAVEYSVKYQDYKLQRHGYPRGSYLRLLTLRSPRHHMWSMFRHCYYSDWGLYATRGTDFPRNHPDEIVLDFRDWLLSFANATDLHRSLEYYHCYHPANYQSRALVVEDPVPHNVTSHWEPSLKIAKDTYWGLDWVSLTAFFHESKCLLFYRILLGSNATAEETSTTMVQDYVEQSCRCGDNPGPTLVTASTKPLEKNYLQDIQDAHGSKGAGGSGRRSTMLDLPADILQLINILTRVDRELYRMALGQFLKEMHWLEFGLGRRVLCDSVLHQWQDELAYLNVSLKELYHYHGSNGDGDSRNEEPIVS